MCSDRIDDNVSIVGIDLIDIFITGAHIYRSFCHFNSIKKKNW